MSEMVIIFHCRQNTETKTKTESLIHKNQPIFYSCENSGSGMNSSSLFNIRPLFLSDLSLLSNSDIYQQRFNPQSTTSSSIVKQNFKILFWLSVSSRDKKGKSVPFILTVLPSVWMQSIILHPIEVNNVRHGSPINGHSVLTILVIIYKNSMPEGALSHCQMNRSWNSSTGGRVCLDTEYNFGSAKSRCYMGHAPFTDGIICNLLVDHDIDCYSAAGQKRKDRLFNFSNAQTIILIHLQFETVVTLT